MTNECHKTLNCSYLSCIISDVPFPRPLFVCLCLRDRCLMSNSRLGCRRRMVCFHSLGPSSVFPTHDHGFLSPRLADSLKLLALVRKKKRKIRSLQGFGSFFFLYLHFAFCPSNVWENVGEHSGNELVPCGLRVTSVPSQQMHKAGIIIWVKCKFFFYFLFFS